LAEKTVSLNFTDNLFFS